MAKKPRPINWTRRRNTCRDANDVFGYLDVLLHGDRSVIPRGVFSELHQLVERRLAADGDAFLDAVLQHGLGMTSLLLLRTQFVMTRYLDDADRRSFYPGDGEIPGPVEKSLLGQHIYLQRHLAELLQVKATTARQRELARAKRLDNERAITAMDCLESAVGSQEEALRQDVEPMLPAELVQTVPEEVVDQLPQKAVVVAGQRN